jgi:hypothetical protein
MQVGFFTALGILFTASLSASASASPQTSTDLILSPTAVTASEGEVFEIELLAAVSGTESSNIGALDALVLYDASALRLLGSDSTTADYSWFFSGFGPEPDGINADLGDGDAIFTALAQISTPATVQPGQSLRVTTLRFQALAPAAGSVISLGASLGSFGRTQVIDFYSAGLDITGDISSTVSVTVGGAPVAYCGGQAATCPCSNAAGPGAGCANSSGFGAVLAAAGSTSLAAGDLALTATALPAQKWGLVYMGGGQAAAAFGDGLRCVTSGGQGLFRYPIANSGSAGTIALAPGFAAGTAITPGSAWNFQAWYRDPAGPCGAGFNTSNALEVVFLP